MSDKPKLPLPANYQVSYGKPPAQTRFKPGQSGNPRGRPKGRKSRIPPLHEERLKNLILAEAYRDVPINERGRKKTISMIEANLRALAMNGAKGNNRAANIFTTAVLKIENERKELNSSYFKSALDYKDRWDKELERRKQLGLDLPDPIPHPDDMIVDAKVGTVHIRGPKTKDDVDIWETGRIFVDGIYLRRKVSQEALAREIDPLTKGRLEREIAEDTDLIKSMLRVFGPPEIRRAPQHVFDLEDRLGLDLTGWSKYEPPAEDETLNEAEEPK